MRRAATLAHGFRPGQGWPRPGPDTVVRFPGSFHRARARLTRRLRRLETVAAAGRILLWAGFWGALGLIAWVALGRL